MLANGLGACALLASDTLRVCARCAEEVPPPEPEPEPEPEEEDDVAPRGMDNWDDMDDIDAHDIQETFFHDSFGTSGAIQLVRNENGERREGDRGACGYYAHACTCTKIDDR